MTNNASTDAAAIAGAPPMSASAAMPPHRCAVYFSPDPASPWGRFGAEWLGGNAVPGQPPHGMTADAWHAITADPRRYGFHATLKAPFRLAETASVGVLQQRLQQLAGELHALPLGALHARRFRGFVALAPGVQSRALIELAARCVAELDDLRAPLLPQELARRQPDRLDARGRELLTRYGYPHVMERFRFHMTLAMCADDAVASSVVGLAAPAIAQLNHATPLTLDRLCLFEERQPGMPFQRVQDFLLLP